MIAKSLTLVAALLFLGIAPFGPAPAPAVDREFRVDAIPEAAHSRPKVAVFPDGGFVVVWTVGPPTGLGRTVIHARFFKRNGSPATGEFRLIDRGVGSQLVNDVVADPDGGFGLAWTESFHGDEGNVFVQRFRRDGTPRAGRIQINAPGVFGGEAVLTIGPGRRLAAAWKSAIVVPDPGLGYTDAVARIFTPAGTALSNEILIAGGDGGIGDDTILVYPRGLTLGRDGSLTVLYEDYETGIFTTHLARVPPGSESPSSTPVFQAYTPGFGAALARRPDGSLIAAWSEFEILARRYSSAGIPRGATFLVPDSIVGRQILPAVAALSNNGYVIVWNEEDRDGDGYGVWGRAFAANGTPLTGDLRLNATTAGHQLGADVATSPGGPVVAVWQGDGIFARILPVTH